MDGPVTVVNVGLQHRQQAVLNAPPPEDPELLQRLFPLEMSAGSSAAMAGPAGCLLDHFRIEEQIGRGGMGAVFRAVDERLDRVVALKVLSPAFSRDSATVHRFWNEAKAAARLDHENIARVFYTGVDKGVHFIAFEYVTGTNLRDWIRQHGRLSPEEALNYTLQIASALRHTSAAGVVHRDIKPSNIIVTPSGRAKLVDLGLARKEYSESAPELTVAGTTLGTFDYISPEQARDPRSVDVRSDIYSLGCTLYHMLTGEPPYPEGTFFQKLLDRQDKAPPDPTVKAPHIPPELAAVVQRMMAGQPRQRYPTAEALLSDLMLVAGKMGLRGIHPEGLIWTNGSRLQAGRFWERHLGWMMTAALLLLIVVLVDRFSGSGTPPAKNDSGKQSLIAVEKPGSTTTGGPPQGTKKAPSSAQGGTAVADRTGTPPGKKTGDNSAGQNAADIVHRPAPLSATLLKESIWHAVAPGTGVLAANGVAARFRLLHDGSDPNGGNLAQGPPLGRTTGSGGTPAGSGTSPAGNTGTSGKTAVTRTDFITVLAGDGAAPKEYPSLEAACSAADDGHVVVLKFNGVRRDASGKPIVERPLKVVNKSITIRAAAGYRPVVRFAGEEVPSSEPQTRMISIFNGSLTVNQVDFELTVDETLDGTNEARWSLFTLQGTDRVWLRGVSVTVVNPAGHSAAVFEVSPSTGPNIAKMKMMKKTGSEPDVRFEVSISDCFFRGQCDLFAITYPRPGTMDVRNAAVVLSGSLLNLLGDESAPSASEMARLDFKLEHVTALTGEGLLWCQVQGMLPDSVLPVRVSARNNIFSSRSSQPLVTMTGPADISEFRDLLRWEGEKNFYDRYPILWNIVPDDPTIQPQLLRFADWQMHWGKNQDVDAHEGGVVWKNNVAEIPPEKMVPDQLRLDTTADALQNPAATGASDGTAAGADLSRLPGLSADQTAKSPAAIPSD